jgi:5'-nucleotidase
VTRPLFLLSNDDGVYAPGLRALASVVEHFGDWVIAAPHVERSGAGMGLSLATPLRAEKLAANIYAVEGTPTDCVLFALSRLLDRRPDFVLSGINRGSNVGQDTLYSGTVAAAMEGALSGIPAAAFSLKGRRAFAAEDYQDALVVVRTLLERADLIAAAKGSVVNVNIPDVPLARMRGVAVTGLGRRIYDNAVVEGTDPRGRPYFWVGGGGEDVVRTPGTDCHELTEGWVTVTALTPDRTDEAVQARWRGAPAAALTEALQRRGRGGPG